MNKRIGFYGGSFDPVHLGHLSFALSFLELGEVDEVHFCPAKISPHKENQPPPLPFHHRFEMLKLLTEDLWNVQVLDIENHLPEPSYTYCTLEYLQEQNKDFQYSLLVGTDVLKNLEDWYQIDQIIEKFPFFVGERSTCSVDLSSIPPWLQQKIQAGLRQIRGLEMSSTEIRERFEKGLTCRHLVHQKVLDYIHSISLYSVNYK